MRSQRLPESCALAALAVALFGCTSVPADEGRALRRVLPLITTIDEGVAHSQVVPIVLVPEQLDGWLALDTGAPFTFLFSDPTGPEFVEYAGTVSVNGDEWRLPGYRDDAIGVEMFEGKPILGVLGLDRFLEGPTEIDYPAGRVVRHAPGELPPGVADFARLPLHGAEHGRALIEVELGDVELTLLFDTGAHDSILVGSSGAAEDERSGVQTADGRIWEVHVGEGVLALPGERPRSVPVLRAPELPYLADELEELDAQGLFGLTSLGWRRIVFDFAGGVLYLGPLATPPRSGSTDAP